MTSTRLNGLNWTVMPTDVIGKMVLSGKNWEPHLMMFMNHLLKHGDIVIDIGACFGWHTLQMARIVGDKGRVYAFEPQVQNYELLLKNVNDNGFNQRVIIYNTALGHKTMNTCLCSAYFTGEEENYGDGFLSPSMEKANIHEQEYIGRIGLEQALPLNKEEVKCVCLDECVLDGPVKFIKIDVQGFEKMVLEGGKNTITRDMPIIVIEIENPCMYQYGYSSKELFEFLRHLGYYIFLLDYEYPCDHVCVPLVELESFEKKFENFIQEHKENNPLTNNFMFGVNRKIVVL